MIGQIATILLLLIIFFGIKILSWLFLTGGLESESIFEKIGIICCTISFFSPFVISVFILKELIRGGLL